MKYVWTINIPKIHDFYANGKTAMYLSIPSTLSEL